MTPITISLLARKGGVGRTTLTLNLAAEFSTRDARVLCIDLDGQASLSRAIFGPEKVEQIHPTETSAALLSGADPEPSDIIHETPFERIHIVPAGDRLEKHATPDVAENEDRHYCVKRFLEEVASEFDLVFIDTAPNTNVLTTWSALVASTFVLSPVPPDSFGTQSIISVQRVVEDVTAKNPDIRILGYLLNQMQKNGVTAGYVKTMRQLHGSQVFETEVPLAVAYREAIGARTSVIFSKPRTKAAKIIKDLADEMSSRIESQMQERRAA